MSLLCEKPKIYTDWNSSTQIFVLSHLRICKLCNTHVHQVTFSKIMNLFCIQLTNICADTHIWVFQDMQISATLLWYHHCQRRQLQCKDKEQDSGNPPTFMLGENLKVCLLWCYFSLLRVGRRASAMGYCVLESLAGILRPQLFSAS